MCGRFTQSSSAKRYAEQFGTDTNLETKVRYNVAPSTDILACRLSQDGDKEIVPLRWGLVPSWSKGPDNRYSMINARAETVASKPAYRTPFRRHRCLVPADGFYEWHAENGKQPYFIHRKDDEPLALAGIWDHWQDDKGTVIESCSIIVCEANNFMSAIHERMPVILEAEVFDAWLHNDDASYLQSLLQPYDASDELEMYPVSRAVNSPKNDSAELIARVQA